MTISHPPPDHEEHGAADAPAVQRSARTALVVAHPDDEALWLSSAIGAAGKIVFCFGDLFERARMSAARRRAVAALPLSQLVNLAMPESGAGFSVDWENPQLTSFGIAIRDGAGRARYEANYDALVALLRIELAGFDAVYTHNPWGEYGHADHIQVYRAVAALQAELGYTIWVTNYVGAESWALAQHLSQQSLWSERRILEPDVTTARSLKRIYQNCGAWTWTRAHRWPRQETAYALVPPHSTQTRKPFAGEWLLDVAGLRWWPPPWRKALRCLR